MKLNQSSGMTIAAAAAALILSGAMVPGTGLEMLQAECSNAGGQWESI
jgi:hypothetical protein